MGKRTGLPNSQDESREPRNHHVEPIEDGWQAKLSEPARRLLAVIELLSEWETEEDKRFLDKLAGG